MRAGRMISITGIRQALVRNIHVQYPPMSQLRTSEMPIWIQSLRSDAISPSLSYCTFVRTGHIMTSRPITIASESRLTQATEMKESLCQIGTIRGRTDGTNSKQLYGMRLL